MTDPIMISDKFNNFFATVGANQGLRPTQRLLFAFSIRTFMDQLPLPTKNSERVISEFTRKSLNHMSTWL